MTSISANSPLQLLQSQLSAGVFSGKIKSGDQSALSSALSDIDSSLQASGLNGAAPGKSTIESLIAKEVASGKLTSDQASELQEVFGSYASSGGGSSTSTAGESSTSLLDLLSSNGDGSNSSSDSNDLSSTLSQFLKSLKETAVSGYNVSGTTSSSITALLVNIKS